MQRRQFLRQASLLTAVLAPGWLPAAPPARKVGLQLYTLREYIGQDVAGVLAKVAKAGYTEIETYGYSAQNGFWGLSAAQFKAALQKHGLTTPSGHYDMASYFRDDDRDTLKKYIEAARTCGQTYLTVPYLDEKLRGASAADFQAIAEKLNRAGELCQAGGLRLCYHNHDFEFKPAGGTTLYAVLLRDVTPSLVDFELDLYWATRAGQDIAALFRQHPGRFPLWHVKDMDKAHPERNTEVGSGSIDFPALMKLAATAGLRHLFVEQENFSLDPYQSISQSATYVKTRLL